MKFSKDYEIISEEKHYAVFKDGSGIEQKVEIGKEVAEELTKAQRDENNSNRYKRKNSISLDLLDYEGDVFATYDNYQKDEDPTPIEKVEIVLKHMKPKQAELIKMTYLKGLTHREIAIKQGVSRQAIQQRVCTAEKSFKKIFEKLF